MAWLVFVPMIEHIMRLLHADLQATVDRFVAAVEHVDVLMQTLHAAGVVTAARRATPLCQFDDPRRDELIDAVADAANALTRYRAMADALAVERACAYVGWPTHWRETASGHAFARNRSFAPTTV